MKYWQIIIGIILGMVAGYTIFGDGSLNNFFTDPKTASFYENHEGGGSLTNPILECLSIDGVEHIEQLNISKFKLNNYADNILASKKVDFISVYVRDLNNGPWVGINEKEEFIGGSLLKLPVLVSYMKMVEGDPAILDKELNYEKKQDFSEQHFLPPAEIEVGKKYKIKDLLEYMINYSDNNAAVLLVNSLNQNTLNKTFNAIGLGSPSYDQNYPVNTKTYAGFFRVLFNASYLNKNLSEATLQTLTHTSFNKGITALLPKGVVVAHKFGTRTMDGVNQLHDCGIVYYPNHPYLLCIMSRGGDFDDLAEVIAEISKFVYDDVVSVSKNK